MNQKLSKPVTICLTLEAATHKHAKRLAKEAGRRMHLPRLSLASFVAVLIEREWNAPKA